MVIGGVAAGLSAASRARKLDPQIEIVVFEKTPYISYGACGLPYYIEGQVDKLSTLQVYDVAYFARERNISVRINTEVTNIAPNRREVQLASGERVTYDALVIATGTRRRFELPDSFPLDTWRDAERLHERIASRPGRNAVVVGGGYIGLEAVGALRAQGFRVTLHQSSANLLGRKDPWLTKMVLSHLERCRVEVHLESRIKERPAADLVVIASGLKPNVGLAADAGVELGATGAIRVTDRMETNLADVYAAGDCAEALHLVSGAPVWIPLGTTANKMGRVAGATVVGARERFTGVAGTSIVGVCGLAVASTGFSESMARDAGFQPVSTTVEAMDKPRYFQGRKTHVQLTADRRTGRLLGGTVIGESSATGRVNVIATALQQRMTVDAFGQLDLAYAPPYATVWDPLLLAARQLAQAL